MNSIKHFFIASLLAISYLDAMEQPATEQSPLVMNEERFNHSVEEFKVIAQYAVMHHNELRLIKERYEIGLPIGNFFNTLRKSYLKIQEKLNEHDWEKVSVEITSEFNALVKCSNPSEIHSNYDHYTNPYYVTAQLLYFAQNAQEIITDVVKNPAHPFDEKLQLASTTADFQTKFCDKDIWIPIERRISSAFNNKQSLRHNYEEKSKLMYTFLTDK
jgi:hypothetical protein